MPYNCVAPGGRTRSGTIEELGDALRVLEQVDSDLHRARFREQSRALGRELRGHGRLRTARLTTALAHLAANSKSCPSLDRKDLALLQAGYRALARALADPGADHHAPVLKKLTVRIAKRRGERG